MPPCAASRLPAPFSPDCPRATTGSRTCSRSARIGAGAGQSPSMPPRADWHAAWWCYTRLALPMLGGLTGGGAWYQVGRFLGPSISAHYRRYPLEAHVAAWRAAGLTRVGVQLMSMGGGLIMWGSKTGAEGSPAAGSGS